MTERQRSEFEMDDQPRPGGATAIRAGDRVIVGSVGPTLADGTCSPDPAAQVRRCLEVIGQRLSEFGARTDDIVLIHAWHRHVLDAPALARSCAAVLGSTRPACRWIVVPDLLDPRWAVQMEAEAVVGAQRRTISAQVDAVASDWAAAAGWGAACQVGERILVSSAGPTRLEQPEGACDPDPHKQYLRCFETVSQTLAAGGFGPHQIVRSNMWLRDPGDATATATGRDAVLNEVQPATSQLYVARLPSPEWRVQIDAEADLNADRQKIQPAYPSRSQGLRVGNRVLVSCLAPIWRDRRGFSDPDPRVEALRCWQNIVEVLEEGGAAAEHLISIRFYIRHPADGPVMARFAREMLAGIAPAVSIVPVGGYMRPEWRVEVEADAVV